MPAATIDPRLLARLAPAELAELDALIEAQAHVDKYDWQRNCLPYQRLPEGDWNTCAWICGRGAGKTRTVCETLRTLVQSGQRRRIGILAPTEAIYRDVIVAGLKEFAPPDFQPRYRENQKLVEWPNGATANLVSAMTPDASRGHNWDCLVAEELCAYKYPEAYRIAKAATRLGCHPITLVATTPKSTPLIWSVVRDPKTVVINASSLDNPHLPPSFIDDMRAQYYGTPDWDIEVLGRLCEKVTGALWDALTIAANRVEKAPELARIVVGIDPGGFGDDGDETGIVVAAKGVDGVYYVLADYSLQATPDVAAKQIVKAYDQESAGAIVYEANQGGNWIKALLSTVQADLNPKKVHASKGKLTRAEPISALYAQGRVKHVGEFPSLEKQMCEYVPGVRKSPDRMDALVWVLTELSGKGRELKVF